MGKKNKKSRQKIASDGNKDDDESVEERFRAAETRPQFRRVKQSSKIVLDERFASVLTDPRFQLQTKDRYGRRTSKKNAKDELSAFYSVEDDHEKESLKKKSNDESSSSSSDDVDNEGSSSSDEAPKGENDALTGKEGKEDPSSRIAYLTAFSRGELEMSSSSSEDDSSQSSEDDGHEEGEDPVFGSSGVLDPSNKEDLDVEITYESSPFLVVMNMDWENIKAVDLLAIIGSFTPPGAVKRVQVFSSDFGMERMERELLNGPTDLWKRKKSKQEEQGAEVFDDKLANQGDDEDSSRDTNDQDGNDLESMNFQRQNATPESDYDPEKLRAYEASKLKYYFAVVEFATSEHADAAYEELDGLEFEHSSAAMDLRSLQASELRKVVANRPMRDQATSVPSNYVPPEFVVNALQKTTVQCTWDLGDRDRERILTKYAGGGGWGDAIEGDDLKAYLASDVSSDGDEDSDDDEDNAKGSTMRKLLGLDSDSEDQVLEGVPDAPDTSDEGSIDTDDSDNFDDNSKQVKFFPGKKNLAEKIRSKLSLKREGKAEDLTPWQKYQEKRKEKRKERRRASRNKRNKVDRQQTDSVNAKDGFYSGSGWNSNSEQEHKQTTDCKDKPKRKRTNSDDATKELQLLFSGEDAEEHRRDYDIRGIQRIEKNKDQKLRGSRRRKEAKLAASVTGTGFSVDVRDDRFAAVLDGIDDRFGIDKTDPNYKDTTSMREILAEQAKRRSKKRQKSVAPDVSAETGSTSVGSSALSALVQKLKSKVSNETRR